MAEYVLAEGENQEEAIKQILKDAGDRAGEVAWSPRPGVTGGGVYVIPDEIADEVIKARQAVRDAEAAKIQTALDAADARDTSDAVASGLATPAEAGFPAAIQNDPGAAGTETGESDADETDEEKAEDAADEAVVDDPNTPEDEHAEAQERVQNRRAARKAAKATPAAEKTESE